MLPLSGCASLPESIRPSYASPLQYQTYGCGHLTTEAARLSRHSAQLAGRSDVEKQIEGITSPPTAILFLPSSSTIIDGQSGAEFARVKDEMSAVRKMYTEKGCDLRSDAQLTAAR